jgi:hypothetical protein
MVSAVIELDTARVRLRYRSAVAAAVRRMGYRAFPGYRMTKIEHRVKAPDCEIMVLKIDDKRYEALIEWEEAGVTRQCTVPLVALQRHARRAGIRAARHG